MSASAYLPVYVLSYFDLVVFSILQGNIQRSQLVVEQLGDSRKSMVKVSFVMFLYYYRKRNSFCGVNSLCGTVHSLRYRWAIHKLNSNLCRAAGGASRLLGTLSLKFRLVTSQLHSDGHLGFTATFLGLGPYVFSKSYPLN